MAKKISRVLRVSPEFDIQTRDIMKCRMKKKGIYTKPTRITLAMTRHPLFPQMKKDIIDAELK